MPIKSGLVKNNFAKSFMKIAITSDIHNNTVNLKKVLDYCQENGIEKMICCGDLASVETLEFLSNNFSGKIWYVFGNMDNEQLRNSENRREYENVEIFEDFGETEISGKKISFTHFPDKAKDLCESGKYNFVFYGHTHKPWEENDNNCKMLNPGNVAGEIYLPTFAVWDTQGDRFDLIRINDLTM